MSRRHIVKSDFSASTNLLRICGYRRTTVLELLRCVDRGANVNFPDREDCGRTPLIIAVSASCRTTVEWLMRNGADVNKFDFLHFTPLHHAVQTGNLAIVEMLARAGALIDSPSVYNWTPLLYAVATFRPDTNALAVIRCLVSFGADVTRRCSLGTVWQIAQRGIHVQVLNVLRPKVRLARNRELRDWCIAMATLDLPICKASVFVLI
jgi:ankyrin repeat protein